MKAVIKNIGIKLYNLKNGPFWKNGGVTVEKHGNNIVLNRVKVRSQGKNNRIIIEDGVRLHHVRIQIGGNNNIIIIGRDCSIQDTIFTTEEDDNFVSLGEGTTTTGGVVFSAIEGSRIIVGNDGMISRDVWFFTGDGHGIVDACGKRTNYSQDIIIGDHVWIGYRAILTKGCKICNNSIIAVGAVCNRSLNKAQSDGCVIGGNPAKVIARDKNWTRNRKDGEK